MPFMEVFFLFTCKADEASVQLSGDFDVKVIKAKG